MRPESNISPPWNTIGTAITWRCSTSCWNAPPSITVVLIFGLTMAISASACTTSGQLWQVSDMYTSKANSPSTALMPSITSCATFGGWPPVHSRVSTSDSNSWPSGRPAKRTPWLSPSRAITNDGRRASLPVVSRLILPLPAATMSASRLRMSVLAALSSSEAISRSGWRSRPMYCCNWVLRVSSSTAQLLVRGKTGGGRGCQGNPPGK